MLTYAMKSKPGDREYNEDYIQMREGANSSLYVLADGLGGCGHGELASFTAVQSVIARHRWDTEADGFLGRAMEGAQSAVTTRQEQQPEAKNMSTTLVVLRVDGDIARWAHIGDSRLYHFSKGKVKSQTIDHSVPQMLVRMGEITPDEIRHHPDRNRLLKTVGRPWGDSSYEVSEETILQDGDAFLLCSDGFWEYITEEQMCRCLKNAKEPSDWLAAMTEIVEKNGVGSDMDNYSAICLCYHF